eukprot:TRINITY_DN5057_c0_g1_i2.p1 TRINITY_DN5057_c0_g1~~TRINITY_DN5057_c0_g1_i2.p1  ORF type:complete len:551 (-),score=115.77 TRINITY_DN5057_c0_g1_i2:48-1700(-)
MWETLQPMQQSGGFRQGSSIPSLGTGFSEPTWLAPPRYDAVALVLLPHPHPQIVRFSISPLARIDSLELPADLGSVRSSAYDNVNKIAYFGLSTRPGIVVRVSTDPLQYLDALVLNAGEDRVFVTLLFDGFLYLGLGTSPGRVVRVQVDPITKNLTRIDALQFQSTQDYIYSAAVFATTGQAFFGTESLPSVDLPDATPSTPILVKVQLSKIVEPEPTAVPLPDEASDGNSVPLSIFIVVIIGAVVVMAALALFLYKRRSPRDYRPARATAHGLAVDPSVKILDFYEEIELGECIGVGGMGEVYKGTWHGTEIAVKKLHMSYQSLTTAAAKDIAEEMALHSNLRHPNIIAFLGACVVPPNICICMEYMPRHSLYEVLHSQEGVKLDWKLIIKMGLDAARGMNFLHSSNPTIIHRDLKSHNLLVDLNMTVKVTDFGSARIKEHFAYTLSCIGTPQWMAPEVIRAEHYNEKCDVYSFGIVLWELLTQEDPYGGMHPIQVATAVAFKDIRPPLPDLCPPSYRQLMTECWDAQPKTRPTFRDIVQRLGQMDYDL